MRLMLLTPGTGHFFCGSCLRDDALGNALRQQGHDVTNVPLYLPMVLERPDDHPVPVHMGGINVYLQQKARMFRHLPRFVANWLDSPRLLRWVASRSSMTDASDLGAMTVSILRGECGKQEKEIDKLVAWIGTQPRPDVVIVSNAMLTGVVRRLRDALGVPVMVTLQGEAPFLDALPPQDRDAAWQTLRERAGEVDALVAVSADYRDEMQARLQVDPDRLHVVHNGIDLSGFDDEAAPPSGRTPPTIGYLARMCRDKGLDTLVDAFVRLRSDARFPQLRLRVAGVQLAEDRAYVEQLQQRLQAAGCLDDAEFLPNIDRAQKLTFLRSLTVMSVPARYGESFGLYLLEAMAAGVPVVQPRHAAFPEVLDATGGGLLCEPEDPASLAAGLAEVLSDPQHADRLGSRGREAVRERFTSAHMAANVARICEALAAARST
jgi:glycosyltransferase involved in cell wall biosynthesis